MRYFFEVSYKGTNYNGWQSQSNGIGIQAVLENALSKILRHPVEVTGSGRTDTGVHCEQQFFHADTTDKFDEILLRQKMNSFLPSDIAIHSIQAVRDDVHARYDAIERTYKYRIVREKDPFTYGMRWHFFKPLNVESMNQAAALLIGQQDFECFSKVNTDVNHFLCDIKLARWTEEEHSLVFTITANRFLRGMVRAIVGTLINVGTGSITAHDVKAILKSRDRKKAGANVPAQGLFLVRVKYPETIFLK